jgi:hypothetical protein
MEEKQTLLSLIIKAWTDDPDIALGNLKNLFCMINKDSNEKIGQNQVIGVYVLAKHLIEDIHP